MNNRCLTIVNEYEVNKIYLSRLSFDTELEVYKRMTKYSFIPRLLDFHDNMITIERFDAPTLFEYVESEGHIPYHFAKSYKYILEKFAENGIYNLSDLRKFNEHVFIDQIERSPETKGLRVIDFDVVDIISKQDPKYNDFVQRNLFSIKKEFEFIDGNTDSWEIFQDMLYRSGFSESIVYDFKKHMEK